MLSSLFGFIYVLLGLETYSLLIGALALFAVVSALMVLTQMVRLAGAAHQRAGLMFPLDQRLKRALALSRFAERGPCLLHRGFDRIRFERLT